ncbi:hypothetical protein [Streptosporangium vulgare]|uniref:hypothetical protein n=1 Tax=Streptosporangium vulgare TaxID=46190 RepID=UPI0031D4FAEA
MATATALTERSSTYATLGVLLAAWGAAAFVARPRRGGGGLAGRVRALGDRPGVGGLRRDRVASRG